MARFSPKMHLFVAGRKHVYQDLRNAFDKKDKVIWFHAASLGEYEQGVPVIEAVKKEFPSHKILITFFSPSGYEIKKNNPLADSTVYLPLDTIKNARKFLDLVQPVMAVFIKYEVWPNYLAELEKRHIPSLLISGLFRENQIYFKWYSGFLRKALQHFDYYFIQDEVSKELLEEIHIPNVQISGDTRFDRVSHQIGQDNTLEFIPEFIDGKLCVVCGSTWPEDETILCNYINKTVDDVKFIIAPHTLKTKNLKKLQEKIHKKTVFFSEKTNKKLAQYQVLIVDNIGLLTKIYSYADIAYVGGAMGNLGLHNILEPATFGVPIIIGKNFEKFPEAKKLYRLAGLFSVKNSQELEDILTKLSADTSFRKKTGMISGHYIQNNTGATKIIVESIKKVLFQ